MASVERPDGARIAFDVAGDPRRPPLLLLGGIGGDAPTWRRDIPKLASELFVVVVDHRGIGRSDAPDEPTTITMYVDDALAALDELRVDRAHVYGHSFGSLVALELALEHPERVRSVIVGAGRPGRSHSIRSRGRAQLGRLWEQLYSEAFVAEHPEEIEADRRATVRRPPGERRQAEAAKGWDPRERLGELRVPMLILQGSADRLVDPENARILAREIPGAELVLLQGAGHAYHSEMPERADDAVLNFVRRHRDGER